MQPPAPGKLLDVEGVVLGHRRFIFEFQAPGFSMRARSSTLSLSEWYVSKSSRQMPPPHPKRTPIDKPYNSPAITILFERHRSLQVINRVSNHLTFSYHRASEIMGHDRSFLITTDTRSNP